MHIYNMDGEIDRLGVAQTLVHSVEPIHFYEGNPTNLHYPLLNCLSRAQYIDGTPSFFRIYDGRLMNDE